MQIIKLLDQKKLNTPETLVFIVFINITYSKIPILRPPLGLSKSGPKVVLKTTFGQSQRWSLISCTLGVENEGKDNLNFANKDFNRQNILILGGLNSGITLYLCNIMLSFMPLIMAFLQIKICEFFSHLFSEHRFWSAR